MRFWNTEHRYGHEWSFVTLAIWKKYPNPFASHVLTADVVESFTDELGILHTTRLFTKKGKLPSWGASLLSIPEAYILEVSTVDPKTKTMHIRTRNLSHRKLLLVEEDQTIRPVGASPLETACSIKVRFISNSSFSPLRNQIEGWGLNRFKGTTLNSSKGLDHVLHGLKAQFERS
ncbi:hypothetical protein HDV03_004495 [Kappamyces sp. JEL0829]|nr:hypothetical protein HDV03_004495 [Kappamyces sp. JEL0829]